jgi:hypothetical protein
MIADLRLTYSETAVDRSDYDDWKCRCGNTPDNSGFFSCRETGELQEGQEWDGIHYRCLDCGVVFPVREDA